MKTSAREVVVNAAGQSAPRLAEMIGVTLLRMSLMHQSVLNRPVPGQDKWAPACCMIRKAGNAGPDLFESNSRRIAL
jgi:hypothetical protein